ncbi:MAG: twin-arginine translocase subunit TatC [Bacteroidales bacterium]|nr:twin-arginine translocase subunit TatC [Bacteroidales bacterium]
MTFWEHIDELRSVLVKVILVLLGLSVVLFCFKDTLFAVALYPAQQDFCLYQFFNYLADVTGFEGMRVDEWHLSLINTRLTGQLMMHLQCAFYGALIIGLPVVLWLIFGYIAPALYTNEKKIARIMLSAGEFLFLMGVAISYFLIFPLALRFLDTYSVSDTVNNMIDMSSYFDLLLVLSILMGVLFQMPILAFLLSKMGILTSAMMSTYRKHAIVAIVVLNAIITPTTDIFTLSIVCLPVLLLYEVSRLIIK